MPDKDYYEILGVPRDASIDVIKRVRTSLLRTYHPDSGTDQNWKAHAHEKTVEINNACDVLLDPVKRAAYDRTFFSPAKPVISPAELDFGVLTKGSKATKKITVFNEGGKERSATLNLSDDSSWFRYSVTSIGDETIGYCPIEIEIVALTNSLREGRNYAEWIEIDLDGVTARTELKVSVKAPASTISTSHSPPPPPPTGPTPKPSSASSTPYSSPSSTPTPSPVPSLIPQVSGLAIFSLVSGLSSLLCLGFITGPLAIITAIASWKRESNPLVSSGGNSLAGLGAVCGSIGLILNIAWMVPIVLSWLPGSNPSTSQSQNPDFNRPAVNSYAPDTTPTPYRSQNRVEVASGGGPRWSQYENNAPLYGVYELTIPKGNTWLKTNIQLQPDTELRANFEDVRTPEKLSIPLSIRAGKYSASFDVGWGGTAFFQHYLTTVQRSKRECDRCTLMPGPAYLEVKSPQKGLRFRIEVYKNTKF